MAKFRQQKIDEEMKKELAFIIPTLKDPRLKDCVISVTSVLVTKDLKFAKIYISVLGSEEKQQDVIKGLNSGSGFIRHEISTKMELRYTPQMTFVLDDSISYGAHINDVIKELNIKGENDE